MPENTVSGSEPNPASFGDVDIAGLVDALELSPEEREVFLHLEESNEGTEVSNPEGGEVSLEGAAATETDEGLEPTHSQNEGGEEGTETEPKVEGEEEPGLPPSVQKRIGKLTAQKNEAIGQVTTLKAENDQLKAQLNQRPQPQPVSSNIPLGDVHTYDALAAARDRALTVKEWALMHPDGGDFSHTGKDGQTETVSFTSEQVRDLLVQSNRTLDRDVPARKQYLDEANSAAAIARQSYPQLFQNDHPDQKAANQLLALFPEIRKFPDWMVVVGDYVAGARARLAKQAAAAGKPASGKVVQHPNAPPANKAKVVGSPRTQAGPKVRTAKTVAQIAESGVRDLSVDDVAGLLDGLL